MNWLPSLRAFAVAVAVLCGATAMANAADGGAACPPTAAVPDLSPAALDRAMRQAVDRSLLWRIDKDGRTSWLYGTLHLGKAEWMLPGPRVLRALVQSDTVALELDLLDPATLAVFTAPPDAGAASRVLTPERRRRLDRQAAAACIPDGALAALRPILQVTTLSMLAARSEGLYGDYGSETVLAGFARARGKPVVALENAAQQLEALGGGTEAEEGAQIDDALDELESGRARTLSGALAEAWARSDRSRLDSYTRWCDCVRTAADRRALARLLDDRNPGLADGIARLHAKGQRVFAAVGALHMVGSQGLPGLLAARGFRVTAIVPADGAAPLPPTRR